MKANRLISTLLATSILSTMLVGCSSTEQGNSGEVGAAKDTIVYSMNTAQQGIFNPLISNLISDKYVNSVTYASLMTVNSDGDLEPYLAEVPVFSSSETSGTTSSASVFSSSETLETTSPASAEGHGATL